MYPYEIFLGMGFYEIFIGIGVIAAMMIFNHFSNRKKLDARLHNFMLADTVLTVILGYVFAVLTQAVYNGLAGEGYTVDEHTGATFLGGLVGGAAVFLLFYFGIGHFVFRDRSNIREFPGITDIIGICIPAAHAFGRIGCLMAGCCHGHVTDSWCGVYNAALGVKTVPVQLFEAFFLFALAAFLWYYLRRGHRGGLALYMMLYGVWRFFAEYMRGDDRGATVVSFLSPSQLTAILLVAGGAVLFLIFRRTAAKPADTATENDTPDGE